MLPHAQNMPKQINRYEFYGMSKVWQADRAHQTQYKLQGLQQIIPESGVSCKQKKEADTSESIFCDLYILKYLMNRGVIIVFLIHKFTINGSVCRIFITLMLFLIYRS